MGVRRTSAVLGVVVLLSAGALASAATTHASPRADNGSKRWTCPGARSALKTLERHAKPHFEQKVARIEAEVAARNLSAAQSRAAERYLSNLRGRIARIDTAMARLAAKIATCGQRSASG
jgi:hypothetical protein